MVIVTQGDVWWAELPDPAGSAPGFRRPLIIVQGEVMNRSRIATVICVPLTSNLKWARVPGNVPIPARLSGLPRDSVANISQIVTVDRSILIKRVGKVPPRIIQRILVGLDIVLGR